MAVSAMSAIPALKETQQFVKTRMDKAVNDFRVNLQSTRTGRANVQMLDQVRVNYYGSEMPINQLAQLSTPDPQMIVIQPAILASIAFMIQTMIHGQRLGCGALRPSIHR